MQFGRKGRSFFRGARITPGALYLLILELGLSLVFIFLDDATKAQVGPWLIATENTVWRELRLWTLVTSAFVQPAFISLLFHGFILWMFVPALERWWGTRRFLIFAISTSVAANAAATLAGLFMADLVGMSGLDAFIYASIVAYGVLFARQPVQFFGVLPMTGKQLAFGILAFMALFVVLQQRWGDGAGYVAAVLLAYGLTSGRVAPHLWWLKWRQRRIRKHLKVVRDDEEKRWMN